MSVNLEIRQAIEQAQRIVITAHKSPDGDSIGSSVGLYHILKSVGKPASIVHPDPAPEFLLWLPGSEAVVNFEQQSDLCAELMSSADLIFALDYNEPGRLGDGLQQLIEHSTARKIMIDHHLYPSDFCDFVKSEPEVCSTAQMIFEFARDAGWKNHVTVAAGTAIYLGIMTDSGSFRFPSVTAETHQILAELLQLGVPHSKIHENTYDTNTIDRIKLRGFALSEKLVLLENLPVAYITLTEEELNRFNYQKGDTEGLVNQILSVQGIMMAVLFSEKDGKIKISFRSKGNYEVNKLASEHFAGGGHKYASGGVSEASMDETVRKFVTQLPAYVSSTDEK